MPTNRRSEGDKRRRTAAVAAGNCAFCHKPRVQFAYLCDDCASRHRERQRAKPKVRRPPRPPRPGEIVTYVVSRSATGWEVLRSLNGRRPLVLSTHATEQEADRVVVELQRGKVQGA